ncbi:MAG: hypothetical protein V1886_00440 [archaeon]
MVKREVSIKRYATAFVFTCLIFIIGIFVGNFFSDGRVDYLKDLAYQQQLDYRSLELQSLYISSFEISNESCLAFKKVLERSLEDVASAQSKVEMYMRQENDKRYTDIKREYSMAQIRYLLLDKKLREICNFDTVPLLYFYSDRECPGCNPQGTILTYLKEKIKDKLLIFSLDVDFADEPLIDLFEVRYNVTEVPSILINDTLHEGIILKEDILNEICNLYKTAPGICRED